MARVSTASLDYDTSTGSVTPTLQVEAGPKVEVRAVGAKVARGRLTRLIPIYEEKTVDRDLLVEGERNLRDYFQSQGYFNAEVVHKQQRVINDRAVIDYLINLGRRHKLVKVEIAGNHYFDTATLRERLFIATASLQYRRGRYSEGLRRRDEQAIADLYRENGFRDVQVTSTVIDNYQGKPDNLAVGLQVVEGPQSFVARLEVEGIRQLPRETIVGALSSAEGQPFSEFNVAVDRDNILARYFNEGFPNAAFEWNVTPAEAPNQVDLRFVITEGERRFVRQVLVSGLETTQPGLVNRNLHLGPGDPLSLTRMADAQRRLYDLGVFARVNMAIQNPDGETQSKYVLYQIEEARKYSVSAGAGAELGRIGGGVSSFENPAGQAGFSPRLSFNVSRLNVNGLGHTLSFKSRVSNLQQRGLINYSAPRLRNVAGLNLSFTALYDKSRDVRTFTARRLEGSVQLSQRLSKATSSLYRFSFRRVSVADLKINQLLVPRLAQAARIGMLSGNLIQDRRDDPIDSRKGVYNTVDLGVASRVFGSEANFTRFLGRNSTYRPLGKNVVLARSLNLGWLNPFRLGGTFGDIPLPERLYSGGASSHRGFPDNQAGPRDESTGFPLGGRALFIHNTEARFPVFGDNLSGVVFHDAGNVYSKLENLSFRVTQRGRDDFDYMVHAVGLGVRYRTPVGPLRLDLAYSLNGPRFCGATAASRPGPPCGTRSDERISRFQFHFSIGQAF
ncbi:MAG: BamA/TamA family outer membrane protein [Candidatus Solibacter usitatus]|nr:BamA/TamA family outer membrane protein [Candidatus Solibacter usitatus]